MNNVIEYGLTFKFGSDKCKLFAVVEAHSDKIKLTAHVVHEFLEKATLSHLFIDDSAISDLIYRYNYAADETFQAPIGELRDAICEIHLSEDNMQAHLTLTP